MSEPSASREPRFIAIRKLVALDIVFHGQTFILIEMLLAVLLGGVLGIFFLLLFFRAANHPLSELIPGLILSSIGLNYLPMLLYAIAIVKRKSADQEVAFELEHKEASARRYTLQSLLLFVPLVVPILALMQEIQKRSRASSPPSPASDTEREAF